MIASCDGCQTRYMLGDDRIPENGIRVRCPKCRFVWRLVPAVKEPVFEVSGDRYASEAPVSQPQTGSWGEQPETVRATATVGSSPVAAFEDEVVIGGARPHVEQVEPEIGESPEQKKQRERTKRLARVFVSDILVYNRDKRDQALAAGTLMTVLGPEIKKAWEAYKEKVGTEVRESNDYFREALNEILADGQEIF
ncbi:MAG TPA: zinc-ribbon domain-containing protein [Candidatus Krumholzibacterium sp.]|nr:zinc-ribbon domain-containing protein [Candidatus Krumholzibacterium sp.]